MLPPRSRRCSRHTDDVPPPAFSDDGLAFDDRASLVARWRGTGGGRSIILNGHVDVVPAGDLATWRDDPWSGTLRDGRIIGRGACDMKAGVSATIIAVRALQLLGFRPAGDVILESVVSEETGGIGTLSTIVSGVRADACVITEPTGLAIWTAQSGALTFRITIEGRAAHAAMKSKGVSAIVSFMPILAMLERLDVDRHERFRHPLFADPTNVAPINARADDLTPRGARRCVRWHRCPALHSLCRRPDSALRPRRHQPRPRGERVCLG